MKILFIITQSEFGGAQRYVLEMARHLQSQKYEVVVASQEGGGLNAKLKAKSVHSDPRGKKLQLKTKSLEHLKRVPNPLEVILSIREIYKFIKQEKPDVLFLCSTTAGILGSIASFLYKLRTTNYQLRTIYRIGGWAFRDPRPNWQNKIIIWLEKLTARFKDKIIVNSEIDRQLALKYKIASEEKIVKIDNGLDVNRLKFLEREEARKYLFSKLSTRIPEGQTPNSQLQTPNSKIIGTIANFYKTKGLEYLIEAIHILSSKLQAPSS